LLSRYESRQARLYRHAFRDRIKLRQPFEWESPALLCHIALGLTSRRTPHAAVWASGSTGSAGVGRTVEVRAVSFAECPLGGTEGRTPTVRTSPPCTGGAGCTTWRVGASLAQVRFSMGGLSWSPETKKAARVRPDGRVLAGGGARPPLRLPRAVRNTQPTWDCLRRMDRLLFLGSRDHRETARTVC